VARFCRERMGRACLLCPDISDIDLFRYRQRIIHLDIWDNDTRLWSYEGTKEPSGLDRIDYRFLPSFGSGPGRFLLGFGKPRCTKVDLQWLLSG
jgi:hypothetical protein